MFPWAYLTWLRKAWVNEKAGHRNFPNWNEERGKKMKQTNNQPKNPRTSENCGTISKGVKWNTRRRTKKELKRNTWSQNSWEHSKINDKDQTTDLGDSENTKQDKYFKNSYLIKSYHIKKPKTKRNFWKSQRNKNHLQRNNKKLQWTTYQNHIRNKREYLVLKKNKTKNHQPWILYPEKLSFKKFSQTKIEGIIASWPALKEMLKDILQAEENETG